MCEETVHSGHVKKVAFGCVKCAFRPEYTGFILSANAATTLSFKNP